MLGDIGRIPIITLSACKSLSEILSELPLPQPTPNVPPDSAKLLNDPLVEESAQTNLQSCKEWLVDILATALDSTSTDSITLKNDSKAPPIDFHTLPPLLKDTISKRPSLLEKNKSFQCIYSNKEVLQILSGGASKTGNSCGRLTSPNASSGCTRNDASAGVATKARSQKQTSQPGLYSVVSVEPLKLSIKRAATHSQQATSDASQTKERRRRRAPGKDTKAPKRASAAAAAATSVTANSHPTAVPAVTSLPVPMSVPVTYAPHSVPKDSTWVDRSGPQITPLSIPVARLPSVVPTPLGGTSAALASAASRLSVQGDSRPTQPTSRLSHESFTPNESLRSHSMTPAAPSVSTVTVSLRVSSMPTSESAPRVPLTSPPAASEPVVALSSAAIATTVNLTNSTSLTVSNSTNNPMLTQLFQPAAHFTPHQVDAPASCESSETVVAQKRLMLDQEGGVLLLPQDSNDAITGGVGGCGGSYNNSLRNNVMSGASSISSVPPSNVSAEGHAILQSGLLFEDPFSVPRSPSSVPSNCSYPATPVVSAMTVAATASVVPTAMPIAASPFQSHSCSSAITVVGATTAGGSATSINLFGVNVTPLQGDDAQSNSAPRGLAAYLKKSKCHTKPQSETLAAATTSVSTAATLSSPSSSSNPNHGSNNTLSPGRLPTELEEDAYTHQHGSAPPLQVSSPWSTDGRGSNPLVHPDQHPRRHIDKEGGCAPVAGGAYSSSLSNTPVNERENRLPGKRRGRRRRSEIEELMNWRVRDPKKRDSQGSSPPRPLAGEADVPPADSAASSLTPVPEEETGVSTKPPSALSSSMVVVVSSDNDTYAEAMVERVKRRRQQRGKAATSSSTLLRSDDGDLSTNEDTKVPLSSYPAASAPNRVTQLSTVRRSDVKSKQSGVKNCRRVLRSSDESEPEQPPPPPPPPVQAAAVVAVGSPDSDSSDLSVSPPRKRGVPSTTRLLESEPSPHSSLPQQQNPSAAADRQSAKTGIRIKVEEETSSSELDSGSEAHKPPLRYAAPLSGGTGGGLMGAKPGLATASFTLKQENDRFDGNLSSSSLSDGTPASRQPLNRLGISSPEKMPRNTPVPPELEQMRPSRPPSSSHKPPRQPRSPGGPPPLLPLPQTANQTELPPSKRRGSKHYRSSSSDSSSSSVFSEREPPFSKDLLGRKQQTARHARRKQPSEMPSASSREVLRTSKGHHRARIADDSHSNGSTSSSSSSSSLSSSDEAIGADERRRNSRMVEVSRKRRKTLKKSASYCRADVHKTRRPSSRQAESGSNASGHFSSSAAGSVALSSSPLSSGREDNDLLVKTIPSGANCGGGATPSTQPCTSSSALEDEDTPSLPPLDPCPPASPESPVSVASSQLSAARDFFQTEEAELEKQRCSEELTNSAAALTKFTAHISDILRRIEELDLLKIASAIRMTTATTTSTSVNDASDEGEEGGLSGDVRSAGVDRTPVEARLGRREINALYHESGQVRVAGSMSTVPTGHLVRLLTLLLVNIRDAATLPAPNPTPSDFRELLRRRKARLQRHHHHRQGEVTDKEQISESLLWSHPIWLRVLRGLDSALIALNIIAGPDVPRPLMMEDLIESICAIVHFHFSRLIDWSNDPSSSKRATTSGSGELAAGLSNLAKEAVGSRVGEALSALSSLVRLGGRFTDSLVLRLTELSLLLSGALLNSPVRRGTCPASGLLPKPAPSFSGNEGGDSMDAEGDSDEAEEEVCRRLSARAKTLHAAQLEYYASNQWRLQLQRSTLGLIAAIYSRYDAHRKLIANDILALLSPRTTASATTVSSAGGGGGGGNSSATSMSRTPLRTFWILASGSFIKGWQPFQLMPTASQPETATPTTQSAPTSSNSSCQLVNNHYLLVHSFSALLLAVVQSLIPAPSHLVGGGGSSSRRCSSAGAPATPSSGVSQQSTTAGTVFSTGTGGDSHTADAIQLAKEEKALLTAHTAAFRAAHYLLTGLFKRASFKGEEDLKPILETVLIDFLRVAADAPLEWPAANLLLNAFGTLLIQQLTLTSSRGQSNHHHSSASNRASETGTRLLAADQLITLAGGLRRLSALRRAGGYPTRPSAHPAAVSSPEPTENKAGVDLSLTEAKLCVSAFLNSPVLSMYHLTLAYDDTSALFSSIPRRWLDRSAVRLQEYIVQRDFAYQLFYKLRFQHFDGLALTSRRFHQATWIQEASQQLSNSASGANTCEQPQQQPAEENLVKSSPKERRQVEDFRLQMLTEFVSTHPSVSGVAPWLPSRRNAAAAAAAGHHFHRGRLASPVHTDQLVSEQGAPTSLDPTAVAAFSPYTGHGLGVDARRRRTAAAHLLALKIFAHIDNSPGFDIIFASIVKLLYDQSVLLRARALKGLSILVDISPDCIQSLHPRHSPGRQGDPPSQGLLSSELGRVIPARLLDSSPAVREAAVELVGRLVAANPDLFMPIYYSPLVARVLDLCVSVRKRAVRSLQTLIYDSVAPTSSTQCLSTKQLVDICVILLRRLHDEDSVKKLVLDTFQALWFTPLGTETDGVLSAKDKQVLGDRIFWLCEVMSNFRSRGFHVMEEFMNTILNMETTEKPSPVDKACEQIVHHLASVVQTVLEDPSSREDFRGDSRVTTSTSTEGRSSATSAAARAACPRHSKRRSATTDGASSSRCTCNKKQQQQQDGKRSHDDQQISVSSALAALHLVAKCRASLVLQHAPMLVRLLSKAASSTHNSTSSSLTTATATPSSSAVDGVGHLESVALFHTTGTIEACCLHVANVKRQEDSKFGFLFPDGVADFEKSLIILLQRQYRLVVDSALACLSTIVNKLTKDYTHVTYCFAQFYELLINERRRSLNRAAKAMRSDSSSTTCSKVAGASSAVTTSTSTGGFSVVLPPHLRPSILRALYTVGLICKHFSLEDLATTAFNLTNDPSAPIRSSVNLGVLTQQSRPEVTFGTSLRDEVFDTLMFFAEGALRLGASADPTADAAQRSTGAVAAPNSAKSPPSVTADDVELGKKAIAGVSFLANRHDHLFCSNRLQTFFAGILAGVPSVEAAAIADLQCIILDCLTNFLMDEEKQMISNDSDWARKRKNESLKELGDRREGHGSAVAQVYLPVVLDYCILSPSATVRSKALSLVSTILRQGLVHPVQTIACLVCLQTDPEPVVRSRATQQLTEAEQKSPGFSAIRALNGIRIGFRLQCLVATSPKPALVRGASTSSSSSAPSSSSSSKQQQEQEGEKVSDPLLSGPIALNHAVYRILQTNRQHRRSLISSLLVLFDLEQTPGAPIHSRDSSRSTYGQPGGVCSKMRLDGGDGKTTTSEGAAVDGGSGVRNDLAELIYVSDQLAHFPYKFQDEVFYLARNIDLRVSSLGSTVVRAMHECLTSEPTTESAQHQRSQSHSDDFYDRKLTNLLEDAEVELFADIDNPATWSSCSSTALPEGLRPMERKLLERMNRAEVAALRNSARSVIIRNAPACLLLMSIRTYLKEAYDVTVAKLRSYSPSDPVKQWEKPISMSARCIQTGAYNRLLEIPLAVEHCALDCTWPVASLSFHSEDDSASETGGSRGPSDLLLLRIFLLLHRQLLATEDEGDLDLPVVGPSGDLPSEAATSRKAEAQATPTTLSMDKWPEGTGKGEPLPKPPLEKTAKSSSSSSAIVKDKLKVPKAAHKETHSRPATSAPDQTKEDGSKRGNASTSVRSVSPMVVPARKPVPLKAKFPQSFTGPGTDASAAKKHSPGSNEDRRASAKSEHPMRPSKSISKDTVRKEHKHLKRTRVTLDISSLSSLESSDSSSSVEDARPQKVVKKPKPESSSMKEKLKFQKTSHSDPKETMNGKRVPSDKLAKKPSHSSVGESKKLNSQGSTGGGGCSSSSSKVAPPSSKTSTKPKEPLPRRTMDLAPLPSAMQSNDNRLKERRKHKAGTDANRKTESRPFRPDVSKSLPSSKPVSSTTIAKKSISKQSLPQATTKNETSASSHHVSSKSRVASPQKTKPPLIKPQKSHDPPSKKPALQVNCSDSDVSSVSSVSTVSTPPDSTYSSSSLSDSG